MKYPGDLVTDSFTGILSPEDQIRFNEWLSSAPGNREKYLKLKELWEKGLDYYRFYQQADEASGWKNLSARMRPHQTISSDTLFMIKNHFIRNLSGIAAGLLLVFAIGYLIPFNNKNIYKTALEQKQIKLRTGLKFF